MDRDYFKHVEEASSYALHIASRTIAIAASGMICVYVLLMTLSVISPVVVSDALSQMGEVNLKLDMNMMANGSHEHDLIDHNVEL